VRLGFMHIDALLLPNRQIPRIIDAMFQYFTQEKSGEKRPIPIYTLISGRCCSRM